MTAKYTVTEMAHEPPMRRKSGLAGLLGVSEAQQPTGEWVPLFKQTDPALTRYATIWLAMRGSFRSKVLALFVFGSGDLKERLDYVARVGR